jgi:hypothetical protein
MKLQLIGFTTHLEEIVATAILTTTVKSTPSKIFRSLMMNPERVKSLIIGLSLQHKSVLEHNRINLLLEASDEEVLDLLLWSKFFDLTRLQGSIWLMSTNLKEIVRFVVSWKGPMREDLLESMKIFAPTMFKCLKGDL